MIPDPERNLQVNIVDCSSFVYKTTHELVPDDIQPNSPMFPAQVEGDGNCLSRTTSVLCYGHEQAHIEMRARIVIELAAHYELYLDIEYQLGTNQKSKTVTPSFAMFSDHFIPGKKISDGQNRFAWPMHPDICWYQRSDTLAMIPPLSKSKRHFQVCPDVWNLIEQFKCSLYDAVRINLLLIWQYLVVQYFARYHETNGCLMYHISMAIR